MKHLFPDSTIKSCGNQFLPDFYETLSESLVDKLNNFSFAEERILRSVTVKKNANGSLGLQITEGSDGKVYVQSVILGGPAHLTGNIYSGDQIIAVNGHNLLLMKYEDALQLLKSTGEKVEFVLSQLSMTKNSIESENSRIRSNRNLSNINESHLSTIKLDKTLNKLKRKSNFESKSPIEKHLTESCYDLSNLRKYNSPAIEVPYHKHIRYEIEPEKDILHDKYLANNTLNRNLSKSCTQIYSDKPDRAVIVDMIPKSNINLNFLSLDRRSEKNRNDPDEFESNRKPPSIALPRSLGLSRKWRGPVKYPVTPIKKNVETDDTYITTSDEEQVFI